MTENHIFPGPEWSENMNKVTEYLLENQCIEINNIRPLNQRYINLRTQEMFDSLVDLYAQMFTTQWHHYSKFMDCFPPESGVSPHIHATRCYISMWFIDLYVSNHKAVEKLSPIAFIERYQEELPSIAHEYDTYLTLLNASIRPTHIKHAIDNAQYIPIISDCIDANNPNPFGIENFTPERNMFYGSTQIMKRKKLWHFAPLSSDPNGRPCWLFDWHSMDNACSWFPDKDNFDMEDVALAYILGTACTPNLGACDVDEWQCFDDGIVPHDPNPKRYDRVRVCSAQSFSELVACSF